MIHPLILSRLFLLLFLSSFLMYSHAQEYEKQKKKGKRFDPSSAVLITPAYNAQFPLGDIKNRFGFNSLIGIHVSYKTNSNWLIGGEVGILFGSRVKETFIINGLSTSTGQHITQFNDLAGINPNEIGYSVKFVAGKIIPFSKKFPDAGLIVLTGLGFLEHKIAVNVKSTELPQFDKTYRTGYDRLSNGPVLSQFIGGVYMERKKFVSFYGGLQFDIGFTKGRRPYDFYLKQPLNDSRLDMFIGVKIGWIIPIFLQASDKDYYYY